LRQADAGAISRLSLELLQRAEVRCSIETGLDRLDLDRLFFVAARGSALLY